MIINEQKIRGIIITGEDEELLAVITDNEITEKEGVRVVLKEEQEMSEPVRNPFELKPCPFCGADALYQQHKKAYEQYELVCCVNDDCGATISTGVCDGRHKKYVVGSAVEVWNRRHDEA